MYRNLTKQGEAIFRLSGYKMNGSLKSFYDQGTSASPADTLLSLFDADDLRLQLVSTTTGGVYYTAKYSAVTVPENDAKRDDPFVFRLSEEFLNAAEAAWHLSQYADARQYIRAILERAVGASKADAVLASYSDATLIDLIRRERVKELCFEGHNLWDITRWKQDLVREANTTSTVRRISYPSDLFVLPIPQTELFANENMQPNPTVNN
jgi:SusD family.